MTNQLNELFCRLLDQLPRPFATPSAEIRAAHWQASCLLSPLLPELKVTRAQRNRINAYLFPGHKVFANEVALAIQRCPEEFAQLPMTTTTLEGHLARAGAYQGLAGFLGSLHEQARLYQHLEMAAAVRAALDIHDEARTQAKSRQPSPAVRRCGQALQIASSILTAWRRRRQKKAE